MATQRNFVDARAGTLTALSRSRRGVAHPLWIASLALLVANDHLLKGAGLLPGWLTGKLSDFAGLIVAPVVLATIAGTRRAGARAAACALVAAGFAAIKLSPDAARALEDTLAFGHIPWRIWSDPTDLAALVVLPAAWWLTGRRAQTVSPARTPLRARDRLLVIAGALACVATSTGMPYYTIDLSLVNRTHASQAIALYRAVSSLDCPAIETGDLGSLAAATFTLYTCVELEPTKDLLLGGIIGGDSPPADAGLENACQAIVIRAQGLADTVLTWPAFAPQSDDHTDVQLYLEEAGDRLFVAGFGYIAAAPATFTLPASGCAGLP